MTTINRLERELAELFPTGECRLSPL